MSSALTMKIAFKAILLILLVFGGQLQAINPDSVAKKSIWVSARFSHGFIIPHHRSMEVFTRNHVEVFEASVCFARKKMTGSDLGDSRWGVSYLYSSLSDTRILGDVHALVPYVEWTFLQGDFKFTTQAGLGLAWVTNPFNLQTNYRNTAIGSHFNAAIALGAGVSYQTTPRWIWSAGMSFIHFSNGSSRQPNYGINLPLVYGGVSYNLINRTDFRRREVDSKAFNRFLVAMQWVGGSKEVFPVGGPSYFSTLGALQAGYRLRGSMAVIASFDVSYNSSDRDFLEQKGVVVANNSEIVKTGVSLGFEKSAGRLNFGFRFGRYLHQLEVSDGWYYDALSFSCRVVAGLQAGILLKTHFARADFIGFGLTYQFEF